MSQDYKEEPPNLTPTMLCAMALAIPSQEPSAMRLLRFPDVHKETVVFTYAGDLWTSSTKGGLARRITSHPGTEQRAKISPDGKWIAFTGEYDGNPDLFVMPIEGGEPTRLTYEPSPEFVADWTPDGKIAYKTPYGNEFVARLWTIDPKGGMGKPTMVKEFGDGSFSPDGSVLTYNRSTAHQFNWRRYRGGTQGKISFFNMKTGAYSEIPSGRENSWFPMYVGDSVYYVSDKDNTVNLYRYDTKSKGIRQVSNYKDADIKWPSTDGETIVYEQDGYLWSFDIASQKTVKLNPMVLSDNVASRSQFRNVAGGISGLSLSPSGVRVAVEARGDIFSLPAKSGETRNMTNSSGSRERFPAWSPDGKVIAYVSDKSGDFQIYTQAQMGGEETKLTDTAGLAPTSLDWSPDGKYLSFATRNYEVFVLEVATKKLTKIREPKYSGNTTYDWSPDSKWVAFIEGASNFQDSIWLFEIGTGKKSQVTSGFYNDTSMAFDTTGKYLFFASDRTFAPTFGLFEFSLKVTDSKRLYAIPLSSAAENPLLLPSDEEGAAKPAAASESKDVKIDLADMEKRAVALPMPAGNYQVALGIGNGMIYASPEGIFQFNFGSPQPVPIIQGPVNGAFAPNASRTKFAYFMQGQLGIANLAPGFQVGQGRVNTAAMTVNWSPREEWTQIFWEAWRYQRDNFYDKEMLGLNWKAIGDKYAKYVPYANTRGDLNYILGLMIGELGTGHSYVQGGENTVSVPNVSVGMLGADFEASGNFVRIAKIYQGRNYEEQSRGPLAEPGVNVKEGEYLLAIDGQPVNASTSPSSLLVGKVGRTVVLTVNSAPSMTGSRQVRVRTIANETNLRYVDWVETNRAIVAKASNGRIGYMHIPNTAFEGSVELIRGFYSQADKDAMLVDERYNGGGYIQPWYVDTLARKAKAWMTQRHFADVPEAAAIEGPKCLLINGYAGSGGDFFPWMFKQAKLGPLIGTRTWGGLVGIAGSAQLIDGTYFSSPEFGIYDHVQGKWIAENTGVSPDMEVDARPDLVAKGQDPQLEAGIKYLMDELAKRPKSGLKRPTFIPAPPK